MTSKQEMATRARKKKRKLTSAQKTLPKFLQDKIAKAKKKKGKK
jgi:hypothetical protein|tara:strand:- start:229 stop:360 length:132 start_codon:yes stop_codon:yes gene_type:complete